ncbi:MAG TPA: bifunctional UDP-3-O-[3-hydroxymyristoyl] N-acetylglucosamine deacetylase/3-hydroxyacyl-ACP dehydratase [candidate division Zixibacteria bacterium]|nr:bifunctional UDP-3-O-[3-hydroxymyristoyl] N-acetylglucosamine deacetylase/3-hydroxyacyl-ACP dehydratase [candidate division Zixibacteria bacterium]
MDKPQHTIKSKISYSGIGLHTGNKTTITFKPAPVNHGITFVRTDLPNSPEVPANIDNVVDLNRGTTLGTGNAKVHTVEHVLSALAGLQLDNVIIELDNNEPPVGDGSVMPFVKVLMKAGVEEQNAPRNYLEIDTPLFYSEPEKGIDLIVLPSDDLRITFMVDYRNPALGTQYTSLVSLEKEFVNEFAAARTFCFLHEVEMLKSQGLIKGGSLENAIVICDNNMKSDELQRLKKLFNLKEEVFVGKTGILNDIPLRFPNEPVRHKVLDLIGDLYLLGVPLKAHVLAARSGHAANVALVKKIKQEYEKKKITTRYQGEKKSGDYLLDIDAIMKIMPHRYPFLLVDRIIDLEPNKKVTALKNVSINEPYFAGHFPGHPIMPGVLIIEAMAQAGGILLLNTVPDPENKLVYFMGIDGVRFRKPVKPGDQLRFEVEMVQFRRGTCKMKGQAFVGPDLVTEAELMATIVDK